MKFMTFLLFVAAQSCSVAYSRDRPEPSEPAAIAKVDKVPVVQPPVDYEYAWDAFNHRATMIWECRGVQSGAFVPAEFCAFKQKVDAQWPDKKIPGHWKPAYLGR